MFETKAGLLISLLEEKQQKIWEYTLEQEMARSGHSRDRIWKQMEHTLEVMENAALRARMEPVISVSGLSGGNSYRYSEYLKKGNSLLGTVAGEAVAMALSSAEMNASMECVVACPTAGSCGIVPAALLSCRGHSMGKSREELVQALFTASGVGIIIGSRSTLAGAEGGCQAECGSAAAMAAAAVTELYGGSPEAAFHGAAIAYKNVLGLVCDPVGGLVEIPCVKRNASGVMNALLSADLALAGVKSYIPFDEVLDAVTAVGKSMPEALRETALGGLAATPTAISLQEKVAGGS